MAGFAGPNIVKDRLAYYLDAANTQSYPGSGTTWTDISGKGRPDGTLSNGPTFDSNNLGSINFDGSNDRVNLSRPIGKNDAFSVDIWHKRGAQQDKYLYSETSDSSNSPFWGITSKTGSSNSTLRIFARRNSGTGEVNFQPSGAQYAIYDDLPHHLVVVYESNNLYFYHDGSSIGSTSWNKGSYTGLTQNTLAGWRYGSGPTTGGNMSGNIYSLKTYQKALTAAEVLQNYNALKGRYM